MVWKGKLASVTTDGLESATTPVVVFLLRTYIQNQLLSITKKIKLHPKADPDDIDCIVQKYWILRQHSSPLSETFYFTQAHA